MAVNKPTDPNGIACSTSTNRGDSNFVFNLVIKLFGLIIKLFGKLFKFIGKKIKESKENKAAEQATTQDKE